MGKKKNTKRPITKNSGNHREPDDCKNCFHRDGHTRGKKEEAKAWEPTKD